ncbi:MAG: aldehyde dehydrogenase [gamma proteobacterium endosymbiont of Lamellibrachia anaximandri]|nr:aldehyde dehydrogenase [gamma proteobacterium endosymbiont of Lamellibrachia anaximandri]MBL3533848.1 aldehyde dehydrogenase [gamma proteobacterium endosymbiont of Lamellibrachia anaximandri]
MNRTVFFAVLIVLIGGIYYVLKTSDAPLEQDVTLTPKEYIELVERKKAARLAASKLEASMQRSEEKLKQARQETNQR